MGQALLRRPQLKAMVDIHGAEYGLGGDLSEDEITVIRGALDLSNKTALTCMTPIDKVPHASLSQFSSSGCGQKQQRSRVWEVAQRCPSWVHLEGSTKLSRSHLRGVAVWPVWQVSRPPCGSAGFHAERRCCAERGDTAVHSGVGPQPHPCA